MQLWYVGSWDTQNMVSEMCTLAAILVIPILLGASVQSPVGSRNGSLTIHINNVSCTGNEVSLVNCQHSRSVVNCSHHSDASVYCSFNVIRKLIFLFLSAA